MIVLACVDTIFFFYFCFDYVLYFNFVTDFSLWLTCRAKQFSSADVEGILGDDKDAYGDVKGVRKLAKKSGKVYKKDRNKSVLLSAHVKRVVVSHMPEVQKRHKNAPHQHTNNIHFLFCYNLHT